jgi:hypothetical protein
MNKSTHTALLITVVILFTASVVLVGAYIRNEYYSDLEYESTNITESVYWDSNVYLSGRVRIAGGVRVTVAPDINITFADGENTTLVIDPNGELVGLGQVNLWGSNAEESSADASEESNAPNNGGLVFVGGYNPIGDTAASLVTFAGEKASNNPRAKTLLMAGHIKTVGLGGMATANGTAASVTLIATTPEPFDLRVHNLEVVSSGGDALVLTGFESIGVFAKYTAVNPKGNGLRLIGSQFTAVRTVLSASEGSSSGQAFVSEYAGELGMGKNFTLSVSWAPAGDYSNYTSTPAAFLSSFATGQLEYTAAVYTSISKPVA